MFSSVAMSSLIKALARKFFFALDTLVVFQFPDKEKKGIALIRLDAIGDFIIWLDSAKEFRRIYPKQKIILLANSSWASLASALPYWDEVWSVNVADLRSKPLYRWNILRKVRRENFEIAIQPTFSRVLIHGDSLIKATHAIDRIGSVGDMGFGGERIGDVWYTKLLPVNPNRLMELVRNAEFMSHLTGRPFFPNAPNLALRIQLSKRMQPDRDYAVLFPGASWSGRRWPISSFAEVGEYLHKHYKLEIVLCGDKSDHMICQEIMKAGSAPFINLAGKTTLTELSELLRNSKLLVSNETSAVHLAIAVGSPGVCILGGGHHGRFAPYPDELLNGKFRFAMEPMDCYNCNWKCIKQYNPGEAVPCIARVKVSNVLDLASEILTSKNK